MLRTREMPVLSTPGNALRCALLTAALCAASATPVTGADEERWYKVELLVFTRDQVVTDELFPPSPALAYPTATRYLHYPERIAEVEAEHPGRTSVDEFGRIVVTLPPPDDAVFPPPADKEPGIERAELAEEPVGPPPAVLVEEEIPLRPTPFVALKADFRELGAGASRLMRAGNATVHFHETWLQPIHERAEALPLVLDESGDLGHWSELQGSVLIYRSRFLHIETNLWRNTDGRDLPAAWRITPPPLGPARVITEAFTPAPLAPLAPVAVTVQPLPLDFAGLPILTPPAPELAPIYPYRHALKFEQRTRMKRNELHYLDHPDMGVVIKITALDEDALESWAEAELMQADRPASLNAPGEP